MIDGAFAHSLIRERRCSQHKWGISSFLTAFLNAFLCDLNGIYDVMKTARNSGAAVYRLQYCDMAMIAFLFSRFDQPNSSAGEGCLPGLGAARTLRGREGDSDLNDRALAARVQSGEIDDAGIALDILYKTYRLSLWQFARQFTPSDDAAQDMVQDVFVAIWIRRESWQVAGAVRAYFYGAVRNRALDLLRAQTRRVGLLSESPMLTTDSRADVDVEAEELESALGRAVDALPERQRTALLLFWHESMNMSEIARVLGITPAASRKLLLSAQASLRGAVAKFF
jgi:RNA polymerase sigma-70 factor, ECF subfamily